MTTNDPNVHPRVTSPRPAPTGDLTEPALTADEELDEQRLEPRSWPQRVDVAEIDDQREKGWPDFHPEDFCHRCGWRNVSWYVDSAAWNAVMRGGDPAGWGGWQEIICPPCFTELAEPHGLTSWRLARDVHGSWLLALAPVSSSGEAESGEPALDREHVDATAALDGWYARQSPAPVPSGEAESGEAGRRGVTLADSVCLHAERVAPAVTSGDAESGERVVLLKALPLVIEWLDANDEDGSTTADLLREWFHDLRSPRSVSAATEGYRRNEAAPVSPERRARFMAHIPAAVPSGGQADGEGDCCGGFVEASCEVGHRILIDDGDGGEYACPACALAARPVLSREALRERLHDHMVAAAGGAGVLCQCDHVWRTTTAYAIHLADVLAGGEQA